MFSFQRQSAAILLIALLRIATVAQGDDGVVPFPTSIVIGEIEVTPAAAMVSKVPLKTITGMSESADDLFILLLVLRNGSSTRRVDFDGWPHKSAFVMNFAVRDEHGNRYKPVTFGLGSRQAVDQAGETIEPGGSLKAMIVCEKPIPLASTLTIDLDGEAIGQDGKRLKWKVVRDDWEKKPQKKDVSDSKHEPNKPPAAALPPPKPQIVKTRKWSSADGNFGVEADFVSLASGVVKLRKPDGSEVNVPLEKLSDGDRKWIDDYRRSR